MTPLPFRIDEKIIRRAAKVHFSRYFFVGFWIVLAIALLSSSVILFVGDHENPRRVWTDVVINLGTTTATAAILLFAFHTWFIPYLASRNFRQQKAFAEEMTLAWTDEEFRYTTGKSQTVMPFSNLYGFRTADDMILLYHSSVLFHVVPVTAFEGRDTKENFIERLKAFGVRRL